MKHRLLAIGLGWLSALLLAPVVTAAEPAAEDLDARLAEARAELEAAATKLAKLQHEKLGSTLDRTSGAPGVRHATLGFVPASTSGEGLQVMHVLPGSGAQEAGLAPGDLVIELSGEHLGAADVAMETFHRVMQNAEPGTPVGLVYRRGGMDQYVEVRPALPQPLRRRVVESVSRSAIATDSGNLAFASAGAGPVVLGPSPLRARLAPVNAALGRYFGTNSGVLVIAGADSLGAALQDGDVIRRIDGEAVNAVPEVMFRVASPGRSDPLTLEIMRDGNPEIVTLDP